MKYLPLLLALSLVFLAVLRPPTARAQEVRLSVVATFSILADIAENVGGDRVAVRGLVGRNGDMHLYEPTPADVRVLRDAVVYLEVGQSFEPRIANLYRTSGSGALRATVTDGIALLETASGDPHRHGRYDPHVWHDVANAVHITYAVRDALTAADPAGRDRYALNAAVYAAYLWELDGWIWGRVAELPAERRALVTEHNSLAYFAGRYGFELLGTALRSVSTDAQPAARDLADLIRRVRAAGIPAVFGENISGSRLMERVAVDADVRLARLYTDALGPPGSGADTYYGLMQTNVTIIVGALSQ